MFMWGIPLIYLVLQSIALAISLVRGLAMVASVVFNALLLVVFIACHLRELMRAVAAQPVGVQLVIYSQMFIIAHAALADLVSR
ncbi:hypothetical protein BYI23_E000590 (plasmid) [Burkholderia sp. YI23]|nr:hypothetical protein BYI23_E000590 [Burkholderia sp. YI23]